MKKLIVSLSICFLAITSYAQVQLYGLTNAGGTDNAGTVFHYTPSTSTHTLDHSLNFVNGAYPTADLTEGSNNKFYGMTSEGGANNLGIIFEWDPVTNEYIKKIDFIYTNGAIPNGSLTLYNGKLYGMTFEGGANSYGVIFEWDPVTNIYIKKIDLGGANGAYPYGSLALSNGRFYGMATAGGANNQGVIFEWDPATNIYTKKIDLDATTGYSPYGSLTLSNGKFYGMTHAGGANFYGVIFEWDPATNIYTKKIDLDAANGTNPHGFLALSNGKFYGMTNSGGANNLGVIFEWDAATNTYTKKIDFNSGANGNRPLGSLALSNGKFYGMTTTGGANTWGVIFEWDAATNIYTKKIDFSSGADGRSPNGSLIISGGKFYGMTRYGGENEQGVIFEWDPVTNIYSKKTDATGSPLGSYPYGSLTVSGSKIYGMTGSGGATSQGVIFVWDPITNIYTKKIDFNNVTGFYPLGSLTLSSGKLYGMTRNGGATNQGVIFEWDPITNIYTKKIDFDGTNGAEPSGSLTVSGGKFYGMTTIGGATNQGVIFEWDPATNIYTKKIDLDLANGAFPFSALTPGNGKFYGTTNYGGANNKGVIFEWDPTTNIYTKKIDFNGSSNGSNPYGSLILYAGKFYGMTLQGGANNLGVIFEWDPVTNIYTKKIDFNGSANGSNPYGSLILNAGKFYGMTSGGGINSGGVIFEWEPVTNTYNKLLDFNGANGYYPLGDLVVFNNSTLPIHLLSFTASLQNINNAKLQWQIATAEDGSKYELLRCTDGRSFLPINLQTGNATLTHFGYTDNALPNGTYYYRLKMTDKDGKVTYSNIAIVKVGSKEQLFSVYPNPVKRGESLQLSLQNITASKIEIINALGQVVYSNAAKQTGSLGISISSFLAPGQYMIRIISENKVDTQKLLIQ